MPELPEVQTTANAIEKYSKGKKISYCNVRKNKLRRKLQADLSQRLKNKKIKSVSRRGKYIIIELNSLYLVIHLGMSGYIRISNNLTNILKHDHIDIVLESITVLRFNDTRKFGMVFYSEDDPTQSHPLLKKIGVEPLTRNFNKKYLYEKTRNRSVSIKNFLMNGDIIAGIGNIYASEALFDAKIKPNKLSKNLTRKNCEELSSSIKKVLKLSLKKGGSSISDYVNVDGNKGYFQNNFKVYGRAGKPCYTCNYIISKITLGQRSSFFCKKCQK